MTSRAKFFTGLGAICVVFLLGFVPQYQTARGLRTELRAAREELRSLRASAELAGLRDLLVLAWMEVNAKNYGVARDFSSRFFTRAGEVAAATSDHEVKTLLGEIYAQRDQITAALVEGQSTVQIEFEKIARRLYAVAAK